MACCESRPAHILLVHVLLEKLPEVALVLGQTFITGNEYERTTDGLLNVNIHQESVVQPFDLAQYQILGGLSG